MRLLLQSFLLVCCSSSFGMMLQLPQSSPRKHLPCALEDKLQEPPKLITWHPNVPMHVAQELLHALEHIDTLREIMRFLSYRTNVAFVITCKNLSGFLNNKWQLPGLCNEDEYTKAMISCAQVNDRTYVGHLIRCSDGTNRYSRKRAMQYFAKPDTIDGIIDVYGRICDTNDKYDLDQVRNIMIEEEENVPAVRILLGQGYIDPNVQNEDGVTVLHQAASFGHEGIVKLLLSCEKTDPNAQDKDGATALHWVGTCGYESIVKLLLSYRKTDPNMQDKNGETALHWMVACGHEDVTKLLLSCEKTDPNMQDKNGETALHGAVSFGYEDIVKLLLSCGNIDPNVQDKNGKTACDWAFSSADGRIWSLLLDYKKS